MATITTTGSGNWSSTTPDAPWPSGTKPTTGDVVEIAAGHTVTLDEDTAVLGAAGIKNVTGSNTSVLDINGTRTINGCVSYSGTATSGFIRVGTGDALTINYTGGAGTTAVTNSGAGYAIVISAGTLAISNSGGTAVSCTGTGRGIDAAGGTITLTGALASSGGGNGWFNRGTGANGTINGNIILTGTSSATRGLNQSGAGTTIVVNGNISQDAGSGVAVAVNRAYVSWTGSRTLATGQECLILLEEVYANTALILATATEALTLANSGVFAVIITGSPQTMTTSADGGTASVVNQIEAARAVIIGGTSDDRAIISVPTLPAVGDVQSGSGTYGYTGDPQTPTMTLPAAADVRYGVEYGNPAIPTTGDLQIPNSGTPTGTQDETSDACVVSGKKYGSPERTGTATTGYTYGDNNAAQVLTTATGAGTYQPVTASNVRKGVAVGVSPAVGTAEGCIDSAGTNQGTTGLLVAGTFYATGWWDGASYVASPDFPSTANVTTTDTVNGVAGELNLSLYTLISGVVDPAWVVTGHSNYSGGSAGTYPTTATSQAAQLATDQAAVAAEVANIAVGTTILGQAGTLSITGTYPAVAYVHADAGTYGPTGVEYTPGLAALSDWIYRPQSAIPVETSEFEGYWQDAAGMLDEVFGTTVTYWRGEASVPVVATFDRSEFLVETSDAVRTEHTDRDFIFLASDLVLNGAVTTPVKGDQITAGDEQYEVLPLNGKQCFERPDPMRIRVYTKRVADV